MTLRRFQDDDATFYASLPRALCLDDPRTGKSVKMLLAAQRRGAQRIGIVTRAITRDQWRLEATRWLPGATAAVWGYEELALSARKQADFRRFRADVVFLDEAQQIRNPDAKRTRVLYGRGCAMGPDALLHDIPAVWILSGTLTPNHLGEMWTHAHAFGWTRRAYREFVTHFCETYDGPYGLVVKGVRPERVDEYRALFEGRARRRRYRDVFPEAGRPRWSTLPLTIPVALQREIRDAERDATLVAVRRELAWAQSDEERAAILARARPHTSVIRERLGAIRAPLVAAEAEALLDSGVPKLVLMAWHLRTLDVLETTLAPYGVVRVDGSTSNKFARVQTFQSDPKARIFLGQIRAAGEGIPLHAARVFMLAELPWAAGDVMQATQRVVSGDCPDAPEIIACMLPGTIDTDVARIIERKAAQLGILNTLETP